MPAMDGARTVIRRMLREAIIDPTREKLDPDVFIEEGGQFEMRPEHRAQLSQIVSEINESIVPVNDWFIKGSILSMQWLMWSDVDVLLEIAEDIPDEQWYDIFGLIRDRYAGAVLEETAHPIEFFPNRGEYDLSRADGIYHVEHAEWIKGPYDISVDVDQHRDAFGMEVEKFDKAIGELSRDLADYLIYQSLSDSEIAALSDQIKSKINQIDDDVGDLVQLGQDIKSARQDAFTHDLTPSEITKYGSRNELPANVIQKLLERYKYMALWNAVRKIREMEGTKAIDHPSEIAALTQRLGVEVGEAKMSDRVLVVVHPGSLAGSANMSLGKWGAQNQRESLAREVATHKGTVFVVLGDLSDEIDQYQELESVLAQADQTFEAGPWQDDLTEAAAQIMQAAHPVTAFMLTGAWDDDDGSGCVNCMAAGLEAQGADVEVSGNVARIDVNDQ